MWIRDSSYNPFRAGLHEEATAHVSRAAQVRPPFPQPCSTHGVHQARWLKRAVWRQDKMRAIDVIVQQQLAERGRIEAVLQEEEERQAARVARYAAVAAERGEPPPTDVTQ
mgnify:CR=1 FL=1